MSCQVVQKMLIKLYTQRNMLLSLDALLSTLAKLSYVERIDFLKIILHNYAALPAAFTQFTLHWFDQSHTARDPDQANLNYWDYDQTRGRSATLYRPLRSPTLVIHLFL